MLVVGELLDTRMPSSFPGKLLCHHHALVHRYEAVRIAGKNAPRGSVKPSSFGKRQAAGLHIAALCTTKHPGVS